jgi:hypothetical protein
MNMINARRITTLFFVTCMLLVASLAASADETATLL